MTPGDQAYLLTLANLLRDGILADPVPAYAAATEPRAMPIGWRRLWGRIHAR